MSYCELSRRLDRRVREDPCFERIAKYIAEGAFIRLKEGDHAFMNKTHCRRVTMILRSSGLLTSQMIRSQKAVNFAFILHLRGRDEELPAHELERFVRRC